MIFHAGRTVLHRYWRAGRITFLQVTRVVADDERGLFLWLPAGAKYWRIMAADGRNHRDAPISELGDDAALAELTWVGYDVLIWKPREDAMSVWWFFGPDGTFAGWKVNLEEPSSTWDDGTAAGVDIADQALDLAVEPDLSWSWKDLDEFEARTGHPLYWTESQAAAIRAEGERVAKLIDARLFPFDGTYTDFCPEPSWAIPQRPQGWDRPRA
jgi:hypothetical protein